MIYYMETVIIAWLLGVSFTILTALLAFYVKVNVKFKEIEMKIIEHNNRITENEKSIKVVDDRIDTKLDKLDDKLTNILDKLTQVRVNCALYNHSDLLKK